MSPESSKPSKGTIKFHCKSKTKRLYYSGNALKVTVNLRDHVAEKASQAHSFKVKYPNLYINLKLIE